MHHAPSEPMGLALLTFTAQPVLMIPAATAAGTETDCETYTQDIHRSIIRRTSEHARTDRGLL